MLRALLKIEGRKRVLWARQLVVILCETEVDVAERGLEKLLLLS